MTEQNNEPVEDTEVEKAGSTSKDFGNLTVEDDAEGTVDPADLADTAGPEDDGGRVNP